MPARKQTAVDELRDLIAASALPRTAVCEHLDVSKRTLELWLTEQRPVPRMGLLAMRWIVQETRTGS